MKQCRFTSYPINQAMKQMRFCWGVQSLDGTTELFSHFIASFYCITMLILLTIYGPHTWPSHLHTPWETTNEAMLKRWVEVISELMKHCFVPPQAVRHQCRDEVLYSPSCSGPVVSCRAAPDEWGSMWRGQDWAPNCRFGRRPFLLLFFFLLYSTIADYYGNELNYTRLFGGFCWNKQNWSSFSFWVE